MVERWPLAEVLTIYIELLTDRQIAEHHLAQVLWQIRATVAKKPGQPPAPPSLVKARYRQ